MSLVTLALLAAFVLLFGAASGRIRSTVLTAPLLFVAFGFAFGSGGLGALRLGLGNDAIELVASVTLVLVLFVDAARIDLRRLRRQHDLPVRLLAVGLPLTVLAGAAVAVLAFPELSLWEAAIVAVVLAPTDAALAQVVISSKATPVRIRQALNVESGLNDGLALPLLVLFLSLAGAGVSHAQGNLAWFTAGQLILGPIAGVGVGYAGSKLLNWSYAKGWIDGAFLRLSALGLAIAAFSVAELLGGNGFIATFAAGLTMGNVAREICRTLYNFAEAEGQLLILLTFVIFGAAILPEVLDGLTWQVVVYALLSLTLVRALPVTIGLAGKGLMPATVGFVSWFGPRGIASIIYLLMVVNAGGLSAAPLIVEICAATIAASVLLHGVTAAPLTRAYQRAFGRVQSDQAVPEAEAVEEMPTRTSTTD